MCDQTQQEIREKLNRLAKLEMGSSRQGPTIKFYEKDAPLVPFMVILASDILEVDGAREKIRFLEDANLDLDEAIKAKCAENTALKAQAERALKTAREGKGE